MMSIPQDVLAYLETSSTLPSGDVLVVFAGERFARNPLPFRLWLEVVWRYVSPVDHSLELDKPSKWATMEAAQLTVRWWISQSFWEYGVIGDLQRAFPEHHDLMESRWME